MVLRIRDRVEKHLPGLHDQKSHGRRGTGKWDEISDMMSGLGWSYEAEVSDWRDVATKLGLDPDEMSETQIEVARGMAETTGESHHFRKDYGNFDLHIKLTGTSVESPKKDRIKLAAEVLDRLATTNPPRRDGTYHIVFANFPIPGDEGQWGGVTVAEFNQITIGNKALGGPPPDAESLNKFFAPIVDEIDFTKYVISHEWGHLIDPDRDGSARAAKMPMVSNYARQGAYMARKEYAGSPEDAPPDRNGNPYSLDQMMGSENYAELFADWVNRPASITTYQDDLAREFGWRRAVSDEAMSEYERAQSMSFAKALPTKVLVIIDHWDGRPPEQRFIEIDTMEVTKGESKGHRFRGNQHTGGIKDILRQIASGSNLIRLKDGTKITIIEQKSMNPSERGFRTIVAGDNIIQEMQGLEPTRAAAVLEGLRQYRDGQKAPAPTTLGTGFRFPNSYALSPPPVPERKVWSDDDDPVLTLASASEEDPEVAAALDILSSSAAELGEINDPHPGIELTEAEAAAVLGIGGRWIGGNWTELRGYAMELRQNDKVYDMASMEVDPDEMMAPGGVTLFGDEDPYLPGDAIDKVISRQVARVLSVISRSPSSTVYRGMRVSDDVYDRLTTVGYEYDESLATATGRMKLANGFASGRYTTAEELKRSLGDPRIGDNPVMLKITGNNIPIKPPEIDEFELDFAQFQSALGNVVPLQQLMSRQAYLELSDERMISGRYRVVGVEVKDPLWLSDKPKTIVEVERIGD
jgi:hypothetical protein